MAVLGQASFGDIKLRQNFYSRNESFFERFFQCLCQIKQTINTKANIETICFWVQMNIACAGIDGFGENFIDKAYNVYFCCCGAATHKLSTAQLFISQFLLWISLKKQLLRQI